MTKHVVYLSYDGLTEALGQSQILPYLTGLASLGYHFHIISFEKASDFEKRKEGVYQSIVNLNISWHPSIYTKKPPVLSTLYDLYKMHAKSKDIIQKFPIALVHCRSYLPAIIGKGLQKKYKIPFLFDMRGFWADERIEGGIWKLSNPLYRLIYKFIKKQEQLLFEKAPAIVSLTENGKMAIQEIYPNLKTGQKTFVIPCCVNLKQFKRDENLEEIQLLKSKLNIPLSDKILVYLGSIGTWYMLDEMLFFYKCQLKKNPALRFLFITNEKESFIHMKAALLEVPTDKIQVVSVPYSEVATHLSLADYSIFFIRPTFSKRASSPIKQGELMAMGIPIICNDHIGDSSQIIIQNAAGVVMEELTETAFNAIDLEQISFDQPRAIAAANTIYSHENGITSYAKIYANLIGTHE